MKRDKKSVEELKGKILSSWKKMKSISDDDFHATMDAAFPPWAIDDPIRELWLSKRPIHLYDDYSFITGNFWHNASASFIIYYVQSLLLSIVSDYESHADVDSSKVTIFDSVYRKSEKIEGFTDDQIGCLRRVNKIIEMIKESWAAG